MRVGGVSGPEWSSDSSASNTATVFELIDGYFTGVSASFVVTGAGLVLASATPDGPVQDVVDRCGVKVGKAGDQAPDLGETEVDELGGSVSAISASSSRAHTTVRHAWVTMANVICRCRPG